MTRPALQCFLLILLAFAVGCGSGAKKLSVYKAKGKVTLADGTPVKGGRIEFQPVEAGRTMPSAQASIGDDGTFVLMTYSPDDGAVEGEHRVLVIPPVPMKPGETVAAAFDSKYTTFDKSGLKQTVSKDETKNDFQIKLDPKK